MSWVGQALIGLGGLMLVVIFLKACRIQPMLHNVVAACAAACWVAAAALWLAGWDITKFAPWLVGFLVLTITGERLELSRMTGTSRLGRWLFAAAAGLLGAGLLACLADGPTAVLPGGAVPPGIRVTGAGLLALAAWLSRYDIARRTVRGRGLTRYMAAALLAGYVWLAMGGLLWAAVGDMASGGTTASPGAYDAELHAVFLGFVMSMIFAHAQVIVPAVLGRPFPYSGLLYLPLTLLHASLVLRLAGGDWAGGTAIWQWGSVLNEAAVLLFLAIAACLVLKSQRRPERLGVGTGAASQGTRRPPGSHPASSRLPGLR